MGYYSEVRCLIYGQPDTLQAFITTHQLIFSSPAFEHFKANLTMYPMENTNDAGEPETLHVLDLNSNGRIWKWNTSFPDVGSWIELMADVRDQADIQYEFARIGEGDGDSMDIETESSELNLELLYVARPTVEVNVPGQGENIPLNL